VASVGQPKHGGDRRLFCTPSSGVRMLLRSHYRETYANSIRPSSAQRNIFILMIRAKPPTPDRRRHLQPGMRYTRPGTEHGPRFCSVIFVFFLRGRLGLK